MSRRALELGESGAIEAVPVRRDEAGRWKRATTAAGAHQWRARAYYRDSDGLLKEISRRAHTKRAAVTAVQDGLDDRRSTSDRVSSSTPFVAVGRMWIERIERADSGLSVRTISEYKYLFERHVDALGSNLRGLTVRQANDPQRLRAFQEKVADSHGTSSARMTRSVLSGVLNFAVDSGVLPTNAMRQIRPVKARNPKLSKRDHRRAFTAEERLEVLAFAETRAVDLSLHRSTARKSRAVSDLAAFMAATGVRIGEALRLERRHVDLDEGWAEIHGTKSDASRRKVWLPDWLVVRLRSRFEELDSLGLVFPSPHRTGAIETPWDQANCQKAMRTLLDAAGYGWAVPHTFRRSVATMLSEASVPIAEIADQLGHANPAMTASVYLGRDFMGDRRHVAELL
jgi:integrase